MVVLDCSAAIVIAKGTDTGKAFMKLLVPQEEILSVDLLYAEAASVCWKDVHFGAVDKRMATACMQDACDLVDRYIPMKDLRIEALSESIRLEHSPYDMFYFVLARRNGATLFTIDKKLIALCEREGVECVHPLSSGS